MARPTRLTPEVQEKILEAAYVGGTIGMCAAHADISVTTLEEWLQRGEDNHPTRPCTPLYREFAENLRRARQAGDLELVMAMRAASMGLLKGADTKAGQFLLACRQPEVYARPTRIVGPDGGAIKIQAVPADEVPAREFVAGKVIDAAQRFEQVVGE